MSIVRVAAVQMRSGVDPAANLAAATDLIREAAGGGARYVLTPEMTNILDRDKTRLLASILPEDGNPEVGVFGELARDLGIVLHIGSMAIKLPGERVANRAFVFMPDGSLAARYDKIHMYDADLGGGEVYRESRLYEAGHRAETVDLGWARLGISICYDVRFPALYRSLARNGADLFAVPAAFTHTTGLAHWEVLLRARAIENGAFVVAAAQGGDHEDGRKTYGHSMIVGPWGEVLAAGDVEPGVVAADIETREVTAARARLPVLQHERSFEGPATGDHLKEVV